MIQERELRMQIRYQQGGETPVNFFNIDLFKINLDVHQQMNG